MQRNKFWSAFMRGFYREKSGPKIWAISAIFTKLLKVKNDQNPPSLVTLTAVQKLLIMSHFSILV
jgi:hypothetical protein